jgi:Ser/Thr protein kinase RdoA (MazF antagonist)/ribose 1,5-bisphosphokinase PhnN
VASGGLRVIELVGPVGAGKSTLRAHLAAALAGRGVEVLEPAAAVDRVLRRSALGPIAGPLLGSRIGPLVRTVVVDLPFGVGRLVRHPRLGRSVVGALAASPIPGWHRRIIFRRWIEVAGRDALVRPRLAPGEVVVFDEGLIHRAVNLFAWRPDATADSVKGYLALVPPPDAVVVVQAGSGVAAERLAERGLPKRLEGREPGHVAAFLERTRRVLRITDGWLATAGLPVVRVDNEGPEEAIDTQLEAQLTRLAGVLRGAGSIAPVGPAFRPGVGGIPRPAAVRSLVGRRARVPQPPLAVLARLGIRAHGKGRPAGGGRGSSLILDTDRGRILLKRYKATVAVDSVRGEHAVLNYLEATAFPAPRLVAGADGETLVEEAGRLYAAFSYVVGHRRADARLLPPGAARHLAATAGGTLGVLHATLAGFVPPTSSPNGFTSPAGPRVRDVDWYRALIADAPASLQGSGHPAAGGLAQRLDPVAMELGRLDATLSSAEPTRGVVHGDYGPYNLLVRPGRPIVVVDFELARLDWWLTDLVTAIPRFAIGRRGWSEDRAIAFVTGYLERNAISPAELERLPEVGAYLALRRAIVCVARWVESTDDEWLAEATEKMNLATAYLDRRHPLPDAIAAALAG